ncbi:MAG: hypothetical protein A3F09_05130 [Chlamydiae bacterium RIFCSPHIGHO2_12_FULL_49_11]|nr:MAG: hypothetical protein A3F09_05130 [Chlamydiae bacterium RIFCSPHIGHO2_12_FULL_49_11]
MMKVSQAMGNLLTRTDFETHLGTRFVNDVSTRNLLLVLTGRIAFLRVRFPLPELRYRRILSAVTMHSQADTLENPQVKTVRGMHMVHTHEGSASVRRLMRWIFDGQSPLDLLFEEMNRNWPWGATTQTVDGVRVPRARIELIHEISPNAVEHDSKTTCSAMAFYILHAPSEGGVFEKWEGTKENRNEVARRNLPPPTFRIKPQQGELVIVGNNGVHAVTEAWEQFIRGITIVAKSRISLDGFGCPLVFSAV